MRRRCGSAPVQRLLLQAKREIHIRNSYNRLKPTKSRIICRPDYMRGTRDGSGGFSFLVSEEYGLHLFSVYNEDHHCPSNNIMQDMNCFVKPFFRKNMVKAPGKPSSRKISSEVDHCANARYDVSC